MSSLEGFGSYLNGIIPNDVAVACGALNQTIRQVRNIKRVPIEKFAQVVINLETMRDLDVNGSTVPVNTALASGALGYIALGSGPNGTYTVSDMFGAMSGLPYIKKFQDTTALLKSLATSNLQNIYTNLYLATTWKPATGTINYTSNAVENPVGSGNYDYYYTVTGVNVTDGGGGYGRENAAAPTVTITPAIPVSLTATIDTNAVNTPATYGKVTAVNLVGSGGPVQYGTGTSSTPPPLSLNIQIPPDSGTGGWPAMNGIVQNYIDAANTEISTIYSANTTTATQLNNVWNSIGTQLKMEQRARSMALDPLPDPKNPYQPFSNYPTIHYTFVDNLGVYAQNTLPHMYSQTLEAISDWSTIGGRSIVGVMREQRNQARLAEIGVPLDNNISDSLDQTINDSITKTLISNGNLDDLCVEVVGNVSISNSDQTAALYTNGTAINATTNSIGYYDSCTDKYIVTNPSYTVDVDTVLQTGRQIVPGSFAASPYQNLIPPELNAVYLSKQLTPATFTVNEAISEVIKCNCDCWD